MSVRTSTPVHAADPLDRTLRVEPWTDPHLDAVGHDPRGGYAERFWLPVVGPTTLVLLRRLADGLDATPEGFDLHLVEIAGSLGLGFRGGRQQPLLRAIDRACRFDAARFLPGDLLLVRRLLPPLAVHQVDRLRPALRADHRRWLSQGGSDLPATPTPEEMRARARSLAASLLELGETPEATERQLHRWRFHPAIAHEALRWATAQHVTSTPGSASAPTD